VIQDSLRFATAYFSFGGFDIMRDGLQDLTSFGPLLGLTA